VKAHIITVREHHEPKMLETLDATDLNPQLEVGMVVGYVDLGS
jgi:hypothetical protein